MLEAIASSLMKAGMYEKAGDFFERLNMDERAIEVCLASPLTPPMPLSSSRSMLQLY